MPFGKIDNVSIKGIGCCLPDNKKENVDFYDKFGKNNVDKFINKTGVKTRYITQKKQCASDLCYVAANNLIEELGWERKSIDALFFISQAPDYIKPSTACILQSRLNLSRSCMAFDINLGCSAFVYGLSLSSLISQDNNINRMLLLIGDTTSKYISPEDPVRLLHGDAGSAIALEKDESANSISYSLKTDGSKFNKLYIPAGAARNMYSAQAQRYENKDGVLRSDYEHYMDGLEIFQFTISQVPKSIKEFMNYFELKNENFDHLLLHQANKGIINKISKKINFSKEKTLINIDSYGNCSGSSIPLLISDKLKNGVNNNTKRVLASGFGIGLSWGVADITLKNIVIPDIIFSNFYFEGD